MRILWSGTLQGDEDETRVRVVLDDGYAHTEYSERCPCGNQVWRRNDELDNATVTKALVALKGKRKR